MGLTAGFRRRVVEPLWALGVGTPLLRTWKELEASQTLSPGILRERQWRRLRDLLLYVRERNPFYRKRFEEHGFDPLRLRAPEDLRNLPPLTKKEIQTAGVSLLSSGFDPARLLMAKTGGSTGTALALYATEEVSEMRNASGRRHMRWSGWEVGEPIGMVWGNPTLPRTLKDRVRRSLLHPIIYLDTMSITPDAVSRFAREWRSAKPTLLHGHARSLAVLAEMVQEMGIREIRPRAVISTSMVLLSRDRRRIEEVFGRPVFDLYGCEEVGLIACECERHDGLHLNVDHLLVEILREDGTPAAPGESGALVLTDLLNRAMPLIRYRIEDMAEPADRPCPCGRGLPLMRRLTGRLADFLVRKDGSRVAGVSLIENTLTRIAGIGQMQIVQEGMKRLRIRIVVDQAFTAERRRDLVRYFEETFSGIPVEIEDVSEILPISNGKYRFSIFCPDA